MLPLLGLTTLEPVAAYLPTYIAEHNAKFAVLAREAKSAWRTARRHVERSLAYCHTRKIVGWATHPSLSREVVLDAVLSAVHRWRPPGTLVHSDQGSQFGSDAWRRCCGSNHF